jgi:predicted nuclease of predicted toxin-antitoxin system
VDRLAALFPGSTHTSLVGLERTIDSEVWNFARVNDLIIVTKDADFGDFGVARGFPPKVIWLRLGNCTTADIEKSLRSNEQAIISFSGDPNLGILILVS